jgi:GNAT superfamily N-acetyltransferase
MYSEAGPGVAEFKRMFVSEDGRGHGLGRLMLERMFEQMISDGYKKVVFSSATFLTHARSMYESAGFVDVPHPKGFPDEWRQYVYFMERSL